MQSNFISEIRKYAIELLNEDNSFESENIDQAIDNLEGLFIKWEDEIDIERKKSVITNTVENQFSIFATVCALHIVANKEEFSAVSRKKLIKLFKHRHLGYGFYNIYDETNEFIERNKELNKILYYSMVCYFEQFSGKFHDNVLAIQMLCEYYPQNITFETEIKNKIVSALFNHMKMAGAPGDTGYAYKGIDEIAKGVNKLPTEIIKGILRKYEFYKVVNEKVYRNQIFTIINFSNLNDKNNRNKASKESDVFKFFFIDSVLLVNIVSGLLYGVYKNNDSEISYVGWGFKKCDDNKLEIWRKENENLECFWEYNNYTKRTLKIGGKSIVEIRYDARINQIIIASKGTKLIEIPFDRDDWILNKYISEEFYKELENIFKQDSDKYNQLLFSYIWIDNYRGIKDQKLSFDHSFELIKNNDNLKLIKLTENTELPKGFFGESIYSMSAIVGRNGTGKTSVIDFMRDRFFKLMYLIDEDQVKIKNGIVQENNYDILECDCVIIFRMGQQPYFITNIEKIKYDKNEILPYTPKPFKKESEGSKVVYFSSMIKSDASEMLNYESDSIVYTGREELLKSIKYKQHVDFSENNSFQENHAEYLRYININNHQYSIGERKEKQKINTFKNRDFWYQVAFLDAHSDEQFNKWFGNNLKKSDLIYFTINGELKNNFKDLILTPNSNNIMDNILKLDSKYLNQSILKLKHFSAGEYAKFSFLSKLYWCLDGYARYHKKIENVVNKNLFDIKDTITNNSTAVIFIDEGELYYHPEWQRTYISTLLDLIGKYTKDKNVTLQIVITSNSPFIISDIPTTDIMFLSEDLYKNHVLTFGSNIHTMLRNGFFMQSTIGEFAKDKIITTFTKLKDIKDNKENSNYFNEKEELKFTISIVGDDLIKSKLEKLYYECFLNEITSDLNVYKNKIAKLKEKNNDSLNIDINDIDKLKVELKKFLSSLEKIKGEENDKN